MLVFVQLLSVCAAACGAVQEPTLEPAVTRREIEAHVRYLASDELGGRFTASKEAAKAAAYLARVLERSGVAPAGDAGTFLQRVPLVRTRASGDVKCTWRDGNGVEHVWKVGAELGGVSAPLDLAALAVHRVDATDDLAQLPSTRCVVFLDGRANDRRAWLDALDPKVVALALVAGNGPTPPARETSRRDRLARASEAPERVPSVRVYGRALERLRAGGDASTLTLSSGVVREPAECHNVVGRIAGTSKDSGAIVLSAHYDHLAHADDHDEGADTIHNGADDDASGCAMVLEIAGALAAGAKPERDVVFLFATGEELGLLGTEEYLDRPPVPLARTALNLNFEMVGRPDALVGGPGRLWLTGHELSNLKSAFDAAKLEIAGDLRPDQHFFERSDNIAFVRRGIVGQTLSSYDLHKDYHRPSDEASKLDYDHMERAGRSALDAVRVVTSAAFTPAWIAGKEPKTR